MTLKAKYPSVPIIGGYNDGYAATAPVGSFTANALGLYDMSGNVMEWCEDRYDTEHDWRVCRGGSWMSHDPDSLMSSLRLASDWPANVGQVCGFRVVLLVRASSP